MDQQSARPKKLLKIQRTLIVDYDAQLKLVGVTFLAALLISGIFYVCCIEIQSQLLPMAVVLFGGFISLLIIIYLQLELSNRIFGPIGRMKAEMRRILSGEIPRHINLRTNDLQKDTIELFNESVVKHFDRNRNC